MTIVDIQNAIINADRIQIIGNNSQLQSKHDTLLSLSDYAGVIEYHPEELVMTVKAGTNMKQIKQVLADNGQALTFSSENADKGTIGGAYAMGNADLRDAVLGVKIVDGQGKILNFGGQVMKNVAGYDVSRLLVGSQGKLAAICEISFKVLPQQYLTITKQTGTVNNISPVVKRLERGLKAIFDPNDVFI
ncbi:MAG: FAD-binding protein [Methylophagaceae bacterium]